jgi:Tfp pilus assembly protein PilX
MTAYKTSGQNGQIGLLVLLLMTVMLTIGVGVINRSTGDVKISREEEESSQVFNAAEGGVEKALVEVQKALEGESYNSTGVIAQQELNISGDYAVTPMSQAEMTVEKNDAALVDLSKIADVAGKQVRVEWGKNQICGVNQYQALQAAASVVIMVFNKNTNSVKRYTYSACDHGDNFQSASGGTDGYFKGVLINLVAGDEIVRVRPIYNGTDVRIRAEGAWDLGDQFYQIKSTATKGQGDNTTKVIQIDKSIPMTPTVFDFALFSGVSIVK